MLASTITPTAPLSQLLFNSSRASFSCCQGSEANQRMRSGQVFCAFAMSSFITRAALRLTSGLPQKTFGQLSEVMAMSTRALFMLAMRASQSNMFGTGVMNGAPSRWIARNPPMTSLKE
jgi:hypothetical protein